MRDCSTPTAALVCHVSWHETAFGTCVEASLLDHPAWACNVSRGVFAKADIPTGTVLGSYPGRRRSSSQVVQKAQYAPQTKQYVYCLGDAVLLDPTDQHGQPSDRPSPGLPWFSIDPSMAYVNEPALGSSVNVETADGLDGDVVFRAVSDLREGEELYIDYGNTYDRSTYGRNA